MSIFVPPRLILARVRPCGVDFGLFSAKVHRFSAKLLGRKSPAMLQRESPPKHALHLAAATTLLSLFLTPVTGLAQDNSYAVTIGQQAYQMYAENSVESVNVTNGNLNIQIPLLSYKQRGSLLPITLEIVFNADNWILTPPIGPAPNPNEPGALQHQVYQFIGGGAAFSVSPFFQIMTLSESYNYSSNSSNVPTQYTITEPALVDSSGAVHLLAQTTPTGGPKRSVDATGYLIDTEYNSTTGAVTQQTWLGPDGVGYRNGVFSDPNGNSITPNLTSNAAGVSQGTVGPIASYTDSLGRFLPMPSNYQANGPQPGCQTFQYPGPPGSPQIPLTFCYTNYSVTSPFNNPDVGALPASHLVAISSVTLPNGTQWKFDYNGYGDLTTLTYPTGATVTYNWVTGGGCSTTGPSRSIQSRTVNTGKRSDTWTYDFSYDSNQVWHGTETDPLGNKIVHGGGPCSPETSTQYIDATAGTVSTTTYSYTGSGNFGELVGVLKSTNQVRRKATTTLSNGLVKQTCFIYDNDRDTACSGDQQNPGATNLLFYDDEGAQEPAGTNQSPYQPTPFPLVLGKLLYQYESDWGQGSPGPLLRQTTTHYKWQDDAGYLAANLIDIPTSVCVPLPGASACSPSTGDTASYTSYGYDENNGSPQGILGNQTSVTTWTGTGPSLTRSTVFNASGMPTTVVDPAGNATTMVYDASGLFPKP